MKMIQIHPAGEGDFAEIQSIAKTTWPVTFRNILTPSQIKYMLDKMYSIDSLSEQVDHLENQFLIARENGKGLGFISYELNYKSKRKTKIHKIYLLPDAHGKGIGKQLIQAVMELARKNQDQHLFLNVNKFNQTAIDFYAHLGFYETSKEVIDIGNGFIMDDLVMELKL